MKRKTVYITLSLISMIGIVMVFELHNQPFSLTQSISAQPSVVGVIKTQALTGLASEEDLFASSDLVFDGQVVGFSQSLWNQDNNSAPKTVQEWESTPSYIYHVITIKVIKPILGVKVDQLIDVTVLGDSPIRSTVKMGQGDTFYAESSDNNLKVGSKGIFLLNSNSQLAWISASGKSIMKKKTSFSASSDQSYFSEKDGEYLLKKESDKRSTLKSIQDKVEMYQPAREKLFRSLENKISFGWRHISK